MPGPRNMKKKKQVQTKKGRRSKPLDPDAFLDDRLPTAVISDPLTVLHDPETPPFIQSHEQTPAHAFYEQPDLYETRDGPDAVENVPASLATKPFIHDPGNGPRVRDARAFLASSFASPPSLDDPLCAEFAQGEMLEMLCSVLPEDTALILWYNKSRKWARVCPACQRLYRLGDVLPEHLNEEHPAAHGADHISPNLLREQEISGLCSLVCFILAGFNYPAAIGSTWGRMVEELDDATWDLLDGPGTDAARNDRGLSMLLKMTRCADLGLGEMLFPDAEFHDIFDTDVDIDD